MVDYLMMYCIHFELMHLVSVVTPSTPVCSPRAVIAIVLLSSCCASITIFAHVGVLPKSKQAIHINTKILQHQAILSRASDAEVKPSVHITIPPLSLHGYLLKKNHAYQYH
jgi:hypothetical protein